MQFSTDNPVLKASWLVEGCNTYGILCLDGKILILLIPRTKPHLIHYLPTMIH